MSRLDRNLHTLAICYRIGGVLLALAVALFVLVFGGLSALSGSFSVVSVLFRLVALLLGAGLVLALCEVATCLQNHERRTFCLVVAWLACAVFPIGAVLGVFTILQLIQPEAEQAFAQVENREAEPENPDPQPGSPLNLNYPQPGHTVQP